MVKLTICRLEKMHASATNKDMGANTRAAFAGSGDNAIVEGDVAATEHELHGTGPKIIEVALALTGAK